jgi:hypothetical protein
MLSAKNSCALLTKFRISRNIFVIFPNIKFHCNRPVGAALIRAERQADGQDEAKGHFAVLTRKRLNYEQKIAHLKVMDRLIQQFRRQNISAGE